MATIIVSSGTTYTISSGGTDNNDTVLSGGTLDVEEDGETISTMLSGGVENVSSGGSAGSTIVSSGGGLVVSSGGAVGGAAGPTTIEAGGSEIVSAGGTDLGAQISGGEQAVYGTAAGVTVFASGTQVVEVGGFASTTTVSSGGEQEVYGSTNLAFVWSGGLQVVASGGTALESLIIGGEQDVYGYTSDAFADIGLQVIESGGTDFGGEIQSAAGSTGATGPSGPPPVQDVYGYASGVTVSAGSQVIESGGTANNTVIAGGTEYVSASGTANGVFFASPSGTLELVQPQALGGTISGWQVGDAIDFVSTSVISASISGSTLMVTVSGGSTHDYQLAGQEANTSASMQGDGAGGTDVVLVSAPVSGPPTVSSGQTLAVSSGQTSAGLTVLSGGTVDVLSGGTVNATISSGGSEIVSSGGTASNTVVSSGGTLDVLASGVADPTTIYSGGSEIVSAGGTDLGALISGGTQLDYGYASGVMVFTGSQVVESGGTANGTTVSSGGSEIISSGGTDTGAQISGGEQDVYGNASGVTLFAGSQVIESGGTASNTTISGGTEYVSSGGTADGVILADSSGTLDLAQPQGLSGIISGWQIGDVIDFLSTSVTSASVSGSTLIVTVSGGSTQDYQVAGQEANTSVTTHSDSAGGTDVILVSGSPTVSGGQTLVVSSDQTSSGITVLSGGTVNVLSGGTTISMTVSSGGTDVVSSGGTAINTFGGGTQDVLPGGLATIDITAGEVLQVGDLGWFNTGYDLVDGFPPAGGYFYSSSELIGYFPGTTVCNVTVDGGDLQLYYYSGVSGAGPAGNADNVTVISGGELDIDTACTASDVSVGAGVLELNGGTVSDVTFDSGGVFGLNGGIANNVTLNSGAIFGHEVYGGTINNFVINSSAGSFNVNAIYTTTINNLVLNPDVQFGAFQNFILNSVTVSSGASLGLSPGTTASNVDDFGSVTVGSGGTLNSVTVESGGSLELVGGASVTSATVLAGGELIIANDYALSDFTVGSGIDLVVEGGATASSTTVLSGGTEILTGAGEEVLANDGIDLSAQISGGEQVVDGYVSGVTVFTGSQVVEAGGTASGTTVYSGGIEIVSGYNPIRGDGIDLSAQISGGEQVVYDYASGATVFAGSQVIESGGVASSTTVSSGGSEIISSGGTDTGAQISGGEQDVYGNASGVTLFAGSQVIESGGTASNTTISGGTEYVSSGGTADGVILADSSGTLDLAQPQGLSGIISGWQIGDVIDFLSTSVTSASVSGSTLIVTVSGGSTQDYQVAGQEANTSVTTHSDSAGGTDVILVSGSPSLPPTETLSSAYSGSENTLIYLGGLTVSASPNNDPLSTTLSVTSGTLSAGGSSGASITLSGAASQINADLASASYTGNSNFYGNDTLSITTTDTVDDLQVSSAASITISDTTTPSETMSASYSGSENTLIYLGGLTVSASPNNDPLSTTLSVTSGTLSAGGSSGASITLSGTASQINADLASASYTGNSNFYGNDTLSITTTDTVDDLQVSSAASITISDTTTPSETMSASYSGSENTLIYLGGLTVSASPNNDPLSTTLSVTSGTLSAGGSSGASITLSGAASQINADLASASYTGNSNFYGNDTLSITTTDTVDHLHVSSAAVILVSGPRTVSSGQTLVVSSGQTSSGITVLSGGTVDVLSGGTTNSTTISKGGSEIVSAGGTDLGAFISGGTQFDYGYAIGVTVFTGSQVVESGGTASNTTVSSGGALIVLSGGLADPTKILSGGSEIVSAGGTDLGARISGGKQLDYGLASGVTLFTGSQVVESGGTANGSIVSGGSEIVSAGGTDLGARISGGKLFDYGLASGVTVFTGSQVVESGGTASGSIVRGGNEIISAGGTDTGTQISGGKQLDYGLASGVTLFTGSQVVESGGIASGSIVSGGSEIVSAGGTDTGAHISGGKQFDYGLVSGATLFTGSQVVESGGRARGTVVQSGGTLFVSSGGTTNSTTISSGGSEVVRASGAGSGTVLGSGGTLLVSSGGVAKATTITSGGSEIVSAHGSDLGAAVSGGVQLDYGLASGTIVFAGSQVVESAGTASGTTVSSGGTLELLKGGTMSGTVIASRGTLELGSGVTLSGFTVTTGATLEALSGSTVSNTGVASGGTLMASGLVKVSGTLTVSGVTSVGSGATLEIASSGAATFAGTINNSGTLFASGSHSLVDIASGTIVNGGGIAEVGNGTVDIQTTADRENVSFLSGGSGVLELDDTAADPTAYGGTISGFGENTHQYIDLTAVTSGAGVRLSYSSSTSSSGILAVASGGSTVAEINMSGHYTTANFHLISGPGGTVEIFDPPVVDQPPGNGRSGPSDSPQISFDTLLCSRDSRFLHGSPNPASGDAWTFDPKGGLSSLKTCIASELSTMGDPNLGRWADGNTGFGLGEWSEFSNHANSVVSAMDHHNNQHINDLVPPKH